MDSMTKYVYEWVTGRPERAKMSNQAIRNELHVNPRFVRRATAQVRSERRQTAVKAERVKAIQRAARKLAEFGIKTAALTDDQILNYHSTASKHNLY